MRSILSIFLSYALALSQSATMQTVVNSTVVTSAGIWSVLQQKFLTCSALTSPCAITVTSTTSGSAMAVYIISDNNIHITGVTGGGGAWTGYNSTNHITNTGNDNLDAAYNVTGTGGGTSISVSLSASATSFLFVGFIEFMPPNGTTASFDVAGTADTGSCSSSCAPPNLTLSGSNDAIVIFDDTDNTLTGCTSPYQDCVGAELINAVNVSSGTAPTATQNAAGYATFTSIAFKASGRGTLPSTAPFVSGTHNTVDSTYNASVTCSLPVTSGNLVVFDTAVVNTNNSTSTTTFSVADGNTRYTWSSHVASPYKANNAVAQESYGIVVTTTETLQVTSTASPQANYYLLCSLRQYTVSNGAFDQACSTCNTTSPGSSPFTVTTTGNLAVNNELVTACSFQPIPGGDYGFTMSNSNSGTNFRPSASVSPLMMCQDKVLSGGSGSTTSMSWAFTGSQSSGSGNESAGIGGTLATFKP
jgi:hypothetical protein